MRGKRILALSLGPIFKNHVHGGSQKIFKEVMAYIGNQGHNVTVLCTRRDDNNESYHLSKNVIVHPILRFKQTFPQSYFTAPYYLEKIVSIIEKEKKENDVLYVHDSGFNFPFLYNKMPTATSLRDFYYPETLIGAFNFDRDEIIVNSKFTCECYKQIITGIRPGLSNKVSYVPNGIDLSHFIKRNSTTRISKIIKLNSGDIPILYPHRPESSKGIYEVLKVMALLKGKGINKLKLLIPKYIDLNISNEHLPTYKKIKLEAKKLDLIDNIQFHPWIPYDLMPEYYTLGRLTFSIGNFVESFPNVSLESIACGTPSISARVAAHRTVLPDSIEPKIDYGDSIEAAKLAYYILTNNTQSKNILEGRRYINENYKYNYMLKKYAEIITNCKLRKPTKIQINSNETTHITLPPWTYLSSKYGLYNDYKQSYINDTELISIITNSGAIKITPQNESIFKYHIEEGNLIGTKTNK